MQVVENPLSVATETTFCPVLPGNGGFYPASCRLEAPTPFRSQSGLVSEFDVRIHPGPFLNWRALICSVNRRCLSEPHPSHSRLTSRENGHRPKSLILASEKACVFEYADWLSSMHILNVCCMQSTAPGRPSGEDTEEMDMESRQKHTCSHNITPG